MGLEIERKFLVVSEAWRSHDSGLACRQGYLAVGPPVSVRVRIMGDRAWINVKQSTLAVSRAEFEYEIPVDEAAAMLDKHCDGRIVEKTRYLVKHEGATWEVDEFHGANEGLIVAEIELDSETQAVAMPPWAGEEVSTDAKYRNSNLALKPCSDWPPE